MMSLANVGYENKTTSEKNLAEAHFVVTNVHSQKQCIDPSEYDGLQRTTTRPAG